MLYGEILSWSLMGVKGLGIYARFNWADLKIDFKKMLDFASDEKSVDED